ncbi:uncharacterized protein K452DRAFT_146445 [Aplosporella prunicola CBS 121167]|uniref:Uncharacterized protein n=1 Tax=Aplosporella prunicola CBS 121167 TaxID=1176127 RepID=A0A6A6BQ78_9PEZI|nr:uncharacterized protein K452DRAFT_146445 [Aplosporella prunicola CBS 121167]KAF2144741.1 hypothetical protein K452DRAFT_146445 [Aplosporella prunicola CBS 121167]
MATSNHCFLRVHELVGVDCRTACCSVKTTPQQAIISTQECIAPTIFSRNPFSNVSKQVEHQSSSQPITKPTNQQPVKITNRANKPNQSLPPTHVTTAIRPTTHAPPITKTKTHHQHTRTHTSTSSNRHL